VAGFNDARISALLLGARALRSYPFPGHPDVTIAVRLLADTELDSCRVAAQKALRATAKERGWEPGAMADIDPDLQSRLLERHIVFRSMFDADTVEQENPVRFFETPDEVAKLDSATVTRLMHLYLEHQEWTNPLHELDDEELERFLDDLGKAPAPGVFLAQYAPNTLRRCVRSMASRLRAT
jgi:hypothetical protein